MNNVICSGFVCFTQFTRYNRIFMQNWKLYFDQWEIPKELKIW